MGEFFWQEITDLDEKLEQDELDLSPTKKVYKSEITNPYGSNDNSNLKNKSISRLHTLTMSLITAFNEGAFIKPSKHKNRLIGAAEAI